jgi:hypothetical protein
MQQCWTWVCPFLAYATDIRYALHCAAQISRTVSGMKTEARHSSTSISQKTFPPISRTNSGRSH